MKLLISLLTLLFLSSSLTFGQVDQTEMLGLESGSAFRLFEGSLNYRIARTDEAGKIVWMADPVNNDLPINFNEPSYIVYGYAKSQAGRIIGDPTSYDYWLVDRESISQAEVYPNPTKSEVTVFVTDPGESAVFTVYDTRFREILQYRLTDYTNVIPLINFSQGIYVYKITNGKTLIKGGKLCVL